MVWKAPDGGKGTVLTLVLGSKQAGPDIHPHPRPAYPTYLQPMGCVFFGMQTGKQKHQFRGAPDAGFLAAASAERRFNTNLVVELNTTHPLE